MGLSVARQYISWLHGLQCDSTLPFLAQWATLWLNKTFLSSVGFTVWLNDTFLGSVGKSVAQRYISWLNGQRHGSTLHFLAQWTMVILNNTFLDSVGYGVAQQYISWLSWLRCGSALHFSFWAQCWECSQTNDELTDWEHKGGMTRGLSDHIGFGQSSGSLPC